MAVEFLILVLRILFVVLLYTFLFQVVLVILKDLRSRPSADEAQNVELGLLVVVESGLDGVLPGQRFPLDPVTSIGRAASNTVVLPDSFVSSQHALLALRDGQWLIEDLGSTNGVFVNRHLIERPSPVSYGDVIQIGRAKLKLSK